ncbi:hypothetical protein [Acanthopleuribacter pedis]|uniref:hypothetical protein n=1 Tax=Acanthopleuribacter pedis TaxID=442870 RepID=UPI003C702E17
MAAVIDAGGGGKIGRSGAAGDHRGAVVVHGDGVTDIIIAAPQKPGVQELGAVWV